MYVIFRKNFGLIIAPAKENSTVEDSSVADHRWCELCHTLGKEGRMNDVLVISKEST